MGFSSYFLITWDLIKHARDKNIRVGPGRGSAAGCAVAYTLWITDLDPIKYDLLFERFLNPSRISMPDIDMDFDSRYRDEMIRYAAETYGRDHVAQIITFAQIKARNAVRDGPPLLGTPTPWAQVAKAMPPLTWPRTPLASCLRRPRVEGYRWPPTCAAGTRPIPTQGGHRRPRALAAFAGQDGIHARRGSPRRRAHEYLPIRASPRRRTARDPGGRPLRDARARARPAQDDFLGCATSTSSPTPSIDQTTKGVELASTRSPRGPQPTTCSKGDSIACSNSRAAPCAPASAAAPDSSRRSPPRALSARARWRPTCTTTRDRKNGRKIIGPAPRPDRSRLHPVPRSTPIREAYRPEVRRLSPSPTPTTSEACLPAGSRSGSGPDAVPIGGEWVARPAWNHRHTTHMPPTTVDDVGPSGRRSFIGSPRRPPTIEAPTTTFSSSTGFGGAGPGPSGRPLRSRCQLCASGGPELVGGLSQEPTLVRCGASACVPHVGPVVRWGGGRAECFDFICRTRAALCRRRDFLVHTCGKNDRG